MAFFLAPLAAAIAGGAGSVLGGIGGAAGAAGGALGSVASGAGGLLSGAGGSGGILSGIGKFLGSGAGRQLLGVGAQLLGNKLAAGEQNNQIDAANAELVALREAIGGLASGPEDDLLFGANGADVFGTRPAPTPLLSDVAEFSGPLEIDNTTKLDFVPLLEQDPGFRQGAHDVAAGNAANFDLFADNARRDNQFFLDTRLDQFNQIDPRVLGNFRAGNEQTQRALQGRLFDVDRDQIVSRGTEASGIFGGVPTGNLAARDLGATRQQLVQQGIGNAANSASVANMVAPAGAVFRPSAQFVDTGQAFGIAANDNQFDARFDQSELDRLNSLNMQLALSEQDTMDANNALAAAPDPSATGIFNLRHNLRNVLFGLPSQPAPRVGSGTTVGPLLSKLGTGLLGA